MNHKLSRAVPIVVVSLAMLVAAGSAQAAHTSAWDEQWLKTSIEGDRFEIEGGTMAQQKSLNPTVRSLGAKLVADHSKSLKDAIAAARKLGISVPGKPSPSMQWELRIVGTLSGSQFDHWYSDLEVEDHKQDITESTDEVKEGTNPKLKKLAAEDLPMLKEHLKLSIQALSVSP